MPVTIESPEPATTSRPPDSARVTVARTRPETIVEDYGRVVELAGVSADAVPGHGHGWIGPIPRLMLGIVP
jgi:hypothetical protein